MKLLTTVAMLVALAFGGPVAAQSTCSTHANMIMRLDMEYGEARLGVGLGRSHLFELWANIDTGSWTILEVFPTGMACARAAGADWVVVDPVPAGSPA